MISAFTFGFWRHRGLDACGSKKNGGPQLSVFPNLNVGGTQIGDGFAFWRQWQTD